MNKNYPFLTHADRQAENKKNWKCSEKGPDKGNSKTNAVDNG